MSAQFSSDLKLKAVKYYHKINNYVQTCKIFECSERSLKRWVERYEKYKTVERKEREQCTYKVTKDHIKFIQDTIKKNNDITVNILYGLLKEKFVDFTISVEYLYDVIRDINITRKRATVKHFPKTYRGEERNEKEEIKQFFNFIKKFNINDIISIDESSVSTSLSFNYCREKLGKRCIKKTDNNEVFKKYSLLVAINNKKCMGYELYDKGAVNSERFDDFLKKICSNIKNKLIILDNGQIHKKESTKKIIKDSGNFLLFTVPYHPRLNCIEQWFNQMKHYIKIDNPSTFSKLKESVKSSITKIKEENYKNYFIYAYNKDYYKNKKTSKKSTKLRSEKIYKV